MKPFALLALIVSVIVLLGQPSQIRADCANPSGNSVQAECRKDHCTDLVQKEGSGSSEEKSPPTAGTASPATVAGTTGVTAVSGGTGPTSPPSSEEFHCLLIDALENCTALLTASEVTIFEEFIEFIEVTILEDVTLTDIEKVVQCSYALKHFCDDNWQIAQVINFQKISVWGYFFDFRYVSVDLQAEVVETIVTLDSNENCALFDALLNATSNDTAKHNACIQLIDELRVVLLDVTWTQAQKLAKIDILIEEFLTVNIQWESFFLSIEISGFGTFEMFKDVCHGYKKSLTITSVLTGSSDNDCPLLEALTGAVANTSFSLSVRNQIKNFHDKCANYFASETNIDKRLAYVSQQYWQLIIIEPWIVQWCSLISIVDLSGEQWGLFYDLIWCSQFCNNTGSCGCMSCGLGSADCVSRPNLIAVTAQNTTILTDVILAQYNTWNTSTKVGANSCLNNLRQAIWNNTAYPKPAQKVNAAAAFLKQYNSNNAFKQQVLFNITIEVWDGFVADFANCPNMTVI